MPGAPGPGSPRRSIPCTGPGALPPAGANERAPRPCEDLELPSRARPGRRGQSPVPAHGPAHALPGVRRSDSASERDAAAFARDAAAFARDGSPSTSGRHSIVRKRSPSTSGRHSVVRRRSPSTSGRHSIVRKRSPSTSGRHSIVRKRSPSTSGRHSIVEKRSPSTSGRHSIVEKRSPDTSRSLRRKSVMATHMSATGSRTLCRRS
jgi:hypothetical protein